MTRQEYLDFVKQESQSMLELLEKKNSDYCGSGEDAFHNLSGCERLGVCSTETGVIIRMFDKFSRLTSFVTQGSLKVKDEAVEDTLRDVVGYSYLLLGYLKSKKDKEATQPQISYECSLLYEGSKK